MKSFGVVFVILLKMLFLNIINCDDEFVSILAPSKGSSNNEYNLAVHSSEMKKRTEMGLQLRSNFITIPLYKGIIDKISMKNLRSWSASAKVPLTMTLYRNDSNNEQCFTKVLHDVQIERRNFYIFIQLDQQIYKPGDEVKFRVIVVDRNLKPFHMNNIDITIIDPLNNSVDEFNWCQDVTKGICNLSIELGSNSVQGHWKIIAKVDKISDQAQTKTFIVSNNTNQYIPKHKEQLLVTHQKNPKLDENVEINIKSNEKLNQIVAFVVSRHGNVESHHISCDYQSNCKFSVKIKPIMMPQSKVEVYSINDKGTVLQGETTINTDGFGDNFLKISLPPSVFVNQTIEISFETKEGSTIYLMGYKKVFTSMAVSNEILENDILNKLSANNQSIINSVITMNSWSRCSNDEKTRIIKGRIKVVQHSSDWWSANDDDEMVDDLDRIDEEVAPPSRVHVAKMLNENHVYPNSESKKWIFEDFLVYRNHTMKLYAAPSSAGVWTISAFSLSYHNSPAIESKDILVMNQN